MQEGRGSARMILKKKERKESLPISEKYALNYFLKFVYNLYNTTKIALILVFVLSHMRAMEQDMKIGQSALRS